MSKKTSIILIVVITVLLILMGLFLKPIQQPQAYHDFADQRSWLGIDNAWNVLSNISFALVGIWGLFFLLTPGKASFIEYRERWPWIGVSIGFILTAMGSGFYHLSPDNDTLVWDRLSMIIIFMSLAAALVTERIHVLLGLWLWPLLIGVGFCSVLVWHTSEKVGIGDLRFYIGVQEFSVLVTLIMLFSHSPYTRNGDLAFVVLFFGLARLCEIYDHQIFNFTDGIVSGHTLKHLSGALAGLWLMCMIRFRKIV